jgi:hypothetical protein
MEPTTNHLEQDMTNSILNPWVEVILEQMWIVHQTTAMVARSIDVELLLDPQAISDYWLIPTEKRLNPLEFHGKRRAPKAQRFRSSAAQSRAAPQPADEQPRGSSASCADLERQGGSRP